MNCSLCGQTLASFLGGVVFLASFIYMLLAEVIMGLFLNWIAYWKRK